MKRILLMALALTVFLWGCSYGDPLEITAGTTAALETTAPEPISLYAPDSAVEQQTQGAVKAYVLERTQVKRIARMGDQLMVFLKAGGTELMVLDPAAGTLIRSVTLNCDLLPDEQTVQVTAQGMGYYDPDNRDVVILDTQLRETKRVSLPENMIGMPSISPALDKVYFCTEDEIRVLEIKSGISRLLRQQQGAWTTLGKLYFDGAVLSYPDAANQKTVFLDTSTGALLDSAEGITWMHTDAENYILMHLDAPVQINELLYGKRGQQPSKLNIPDDVVLPLPNNNAVVTAGGEDGLCLNYYVLDSGSRTAQVQISGNKSLLGVCAVREGIVWLLVWDADLEQNMLYRWDTMASAVADDAVYSGTWFTAEAPDTAGLAACQAEADAIADKYGVDIRIGSYAVEVPCDYPMKAEFHVEIFREKLKIVDEALSKFPEGFWKQVGKVSDSGKIHICLVRSVSDDVTGIQFWHQGEAYAAVQMNQFLEHNLYQELYLILDTYIFNNTSALDTWDWQNPKKFSYFESYTYDPPQANEDWLTGENRAFVDDFGMTYPREDRAQFFASAMTEGNEAVFESETMQTKLRFLGKGIREAFKWKKDERSFPWEQYLNNPLAYTKKK